MADSYIEQMQFLHDSIDPNGMRISGAEFFYLDRKLLVSIAGSVITYTVILVQSSHGFSPRASTGMVNKGT
ncbi:gustatory receptor for sugar taste 64f-like [Dermacentor variabilis]|uniref:gustatory receptor for sugar taste 64f-like n=1 Tax=Dermacentor variabilis TaxID=34621 RepID=UPI003F5C9276